MRIRTLHHASRRRWRTAAAVAAACSGLLAAAVAPAAAAMPATVPATVTGSATQVGHWNLDEGSGTSAADSSGNGNTGTVGSGATWAAGEVGPYALALNGTAAGNVVVQNPVVDTSSSFTVSAWVKLNTTAGYQTAVSIDGTNVSGFYLQQRGDTGEFAFTRLAGDSTSAAGAIASANFAPSTGTWYHLVGVDDVAAGALRLYVDGQEQTDAAYTGPWKAAGHTLIGRGLFGGNQVDFVNGSVDDVQIFQGAMTTSQVLTLNQSAHWTYDEGSGTDFTCSVTTKIKKVWVYGYNAPKNPEEYNVTFYKNSSTDGTDEPNDNKVKCSYTSLSGAGGGSYPTHVLTKLALPTACALKAGHYWVSVQNNDSSGPWYHEMQSNLQGTQADWIDRNNTFGSGCSTFNNDEYLQNCLGYTYPDYMLELH